MSEIRPIPDYPNYGVTRDGRVWSYKRSRFLKPYSNPKLGNFVTLCVDGIKYSKLVRRLVFGTFTGTTPECLIQKDGDIFNDKLENLTPVTRSENGAIGVKKNKQTVREICRINIATQKMDIIKVPRKDKSYMRIYRAANRYTITSEGCFYYYPGEKDELVAEIKARIRSNQLTIEDLTSWDESSPYIQTTKNQIKKEKKYLEILEGVDG